MPIEKLEEIWIILSDIVNESGDSKAKEYLLSVFLEREKELKEKIEKLKVINCHTDSSIFNTWDFYKKDDVLQALSLLDIDEK